MASIVVGSVSVDVVPNALNFARDLKTQIEGPVDAIGQEVGQTLSDAVVDHLVDAIPEGLAAGVPESAEMGDSAGAKFGDAFSTQIRTKIDAALKSLPSADLHLDDTEAFAKISEIRDQLTELGYNELDISVTDDEAIAKLEQLRAELEELSLTSPDIRVRVDAADAEAKLAALLAQIYELDAAQQALASSMAGDIAAEHALAGLMGADVEAEHALAQSMADDWDEATKAIGGASGSVSGFGVVLAGIALVAAPVLGVLAAGAADLVIGIKNATVETGNLKSGWQDLEAEAGKAISPGLQAAVDGLSRAIPALDPLVATLSTDLGNALDEAATWLGNGGAKEIVDYLQTEIPIVGGAFESLGSALSGFIAITQGPANALLETFTDMAKAISVVEGVIGKGEGFVSAANNAGAPKTSNASAGPNKGMSDEQYLGAVVKDTFTLGGLLGGGSGSKSPAATVKTTQQPFALSVLQHGVGQSEGQGPQLNSEDLQKAASGLDANTAAATKNAAAYGETISQYQTAAATAAQFKLQTDANTEAMQAENNATGLLSQALQGLGGNDLGVAQTNTTFHASITALNSALKTNGDTLDINTAKGQANRSAIEASIGAAQAHMQAIAQQTGSTEQATAAYNQDIDTLKQQLQATGLSKQAIDEYVDSIDQIKPIAKTQIDIDSDAAKAAIADLKNQLNAIANPRISVTVVTSEAALRAAANQADGSMLSFYANGGMENHVAQMAPAGAMRVWAEPETGGESYIPHAVSKRPRSEAILNETAKLFGGAYIPKGARNFADGLVMRGSTSAPGGGSHGNGHTHPITVQLNGREITKVVNEQNRWNGRL